MLTVLTVLTVSSAAVLTLMILVPVLPSRENVIPIPTVRRKVCALRSRPASARGFLAHPMPPGGLSRALSAHNRRRSEALPVQLVRSAMIERRHVAMGSASTMLSMAVLGFAAEAGAKVPAGHRAVLQAVAQSAKSAIRGSACGRTRPGGLWRRATRQSP